MKKIYIPAKHDGISWRELKYRATRHFELIAPLFWIYLWGSAYIGSSVMVNPPPNPYWPAYYFVVIFGLLANIFFWSLIKTQEKAKKIYAEYV